MNKQLKKNIDIVGMYSSGNRHHTRDIRGQHVVFIASGSRFGNAAVKSRRAATRCAIQINDQSNPRHVLYSVSFSVAFAIIRGADSGGGGGWGVHPPRFKVGVVCKIIPPPPRFHGDDKKSLEIENENEISTFLALIICKASSFKIV